MSIEKIEHFYRTFFHPLGSLSQSQINVEALRCTSQGKRLEVVSHIRRRHHLRNRKGVDDKKDRQQNLFRFKQSQQLNLNQRFSN